MTRWKADVRFGAAPAASADVFGNNCCTGLKLGAQRTTGATASQSTIQDLLASLAMGGQRFFGTWFVHKECSAIRHGYLTPRLVRSATTYPNRAIVKSCMLSHNCKVGGELSFPSQGRQQGRSQGCGQGGGCRG